MIPETSLIIHPGKAVWTIYIDAVCINYDGNPLDATLLAMVAALNNSEYNSLLTKAIIHLFTASLPKATFDEDRGVTICSREESTTLGIQNVPISMTFGVFDSYVHVTPVTVYLLNHHNRTHVIADPTSFEEPLLDSTVTVVLQGDEAISVSQGGLGTSQKTSSDNPVKLLVDCVEIAKKRQETVQEILANTIKSLS